jgi:hypothetical protein
VQGLTCCPAEEEALLLLLLVTIMLMQVVRVHTRRAVPPASRRAEVLLQLLLLLLHHCRTAAGTGACPCSSCSHCPAAPCRRQATCQCSGARPHWRSEARHAPCSCCVGGWGAQGGCVQHPGAQQAVHVRMQRRGLVLVTGVVGEGRGGGADLEVGDEAESAGIIYQLQTRQHITLLLTRMSLRVCSFQLPRCSTGGITPLRAHDTRPLGSSLSPRAALDCNQTATSTVRRLSSQPLRSSLKLLLMAASSLIKPHHLMALRASATCASALSWSLKLNTHLPVPGREAGVCRRQATQEQQQRVRMCSHHPCHHHTVPTCSVEHKRLAAGQQAEHVGLDAKRL